MNIQDKIFCMEQKEKTAFVHIENYTGEKPIEIIYREDQPAKHLDPIPAKLPEAFNIEGIITAPYEWLSKHINEVDQTNCIIEVTREDAEIKLVINERNYHEGFSVHDVERVVSTELKGFSLIPRSSVSGSIQYTKEFERLRINDDTFWAPQKLAKFLRLNRHIFADTEEGMALVSLLKNVKAKITGDYEKTKETHGNISRTEFFEQQVKHNLPDSFSIFLQIFKGGSKEKYEIDIDADIIDGEIMVQLISPAVNAANESARDSLIDAELSRLAALAPDIAIIEF